VDLDRLLSSIARGVRSALALCSNTPTSCRFQKLVKFWVNPLLIYYLSFI